MNKISFIKYLTHNKHKIYKDMDLSIFDFNCLNKNNENSLIYIFNNNKTKNLNFNTSQLSYIIKNINIDYHNLFTGTYLHHYFNNFYTQDIDLTDDDFVTLLQYNKFYNTSLRNGTVVDSALLNPNFLKLKSSQLNIFFDAVAQYLDENIVNDSHHTHALLQQIHTYPKAIDFFHYIYPRLNKIKEINDCIFTSSKNYDFSKFANYIKSSQEQEILEKSIKQNNLLNKQLSTNFKI